MKSEQAGISVNTIEIPAYGFLQEKILVKTFVDKNIVFRLEANSNRRNDLMEWHYDNLKCYYKLPGK